MKNELLTFLFSPLCGLYLCGLLVAFVLSAGFGGCHATGDYYGTREQIHADNRDGRIGFAGAGKNAPGITQTVSDNSGKLCTAGAVAVIAGGACFFRRELSEFGTGLVAAGIVLCVLAYILPLYAGWFALGLCCALVAWCFPPVYKRIASLFTKNASTPAGAETQPVT